MNNDTFLLIGVMLVIGAGLGLLVDSVTKGLYVPRHWHMLAFPSILYMIGFHIWEKFKNDIGAFLTMLAFHAGGLMLQWYQAKAGVMYQGYNTAINTPDPKTIKTDPESSMPEVKTYKPIPQFEQVIEMPSFNLERRFSIDVLRMYDFDPETQKHVDLTEERWVTNKKMFSQKPFELLKKKWTHFGLIRKKGNYKTSKFIVASREAVALVAAGNALPEWKPPTPSQ